jgi:hypothetical protein
VLCTYTIFLLVRILLYCLVNLVDMVTASVCNPTVGKEFVVNCSNVPVVPFFVCVRSCALRGLSRNGNVYSFLQSANFLFLIK